jgi:hypothetical protein
MSGERSMRPALWLIFSVLAIVVGAAMAVWSLSAATHLGDAADAPACGSDFGDGCVTERAAIIQSRGYSRRFWITQEQLWFARVLAGAPKVDSNGLLELTIPRQDGREELDRGREVTVLYLGLEPAWVRLPSGAMLETGEHPRRAAPSLGWYALFMLSLGALGIETAVRSGRRGGVWWGRTPIQATLGPPFVLMMAGMFGVCVQLLAGGTVWPGLVGGAAGLALGLLGWRWTKRRGARPSVS